MTIGEIASMVIRRNAQGFSEPADVIPAINAVVQMLYKVEHPQTLSINAANGRLPFLVTHDEVYEYELPDNLWRVANIMLESYHYETDYSFHQENLQRNDTEPLVMGGREYYPYFQVVTTDALEGAGPIVRFTENPRETTDRYYYQAYRKHPKIQSNRQQLLIPDSEGAHFRIVLPAVTAWIEAQNNGNYAEVIEYIEGTLKPKLYEILRGGAQGRTHRVTPRPY